MHDSGSEDLRALLVAGPRLLAGWACVAVAVLNLSMGLGPGPYLLFHAVLLLGGVVLLFLGQLPGEPTPIGYAVGGALAVLALVVAALPRTRDVCCLGTLDVRHGYPLTLLAWDAGRPHHFAPAHAVADLAFWLLGSLILLTLVSQFRRAPAPASSAAGPAPVPAGRTTHAEDRAAGAGPAAAHPLERADDENVGGLP